MEQRPGDGAADAEQPSVGLTATKRIYGGQEPRAGRTQGGERARLDRQPFDDFRKPVGAGSVRFRVLASGDHDERGHGDQHYRHVKHRVPVEREVEDRPHREQQCRDAREQKRTEDRVQGPREENIRNGRHCGGRRRSTVNPTCSSRRFNVDFLPYAHEHRMSTSAVTRSETLLSRRQASVVRIQITSRKKIRIEV